MKYLRKRMINAKAILQGDAQNSTTFRSINLTVEVFIPRFLIELNCSPMTPGAGGGVVVKALRYKLAGRGFDSRWCHWNFLVT